MKEEYQIEIGSPIDYEELVAYVSINGQYICLINMEEGRDNLKIEFYHEPKIKGVDYDIFIKALQDAKKELLK